MSLSRGQLQGRGYRGFVSFDDLRKTQLIHVHQSPGTYAVLVDGIVPDFLETSRGGHFKGKNPAVTIGDLRNKWVETAEIAYIGKAENLQRRLREFCRFGAGARIGHWGGRYVWQVAGSDKWLVCWKPCNQGETALKAESELLDEFAVAHSGRLPFANLRR